MSHQDDVNLRKNIATFKSIVEGAVPDSVTAFTRHGNARLEPAWLASVAITCMAWMSEDTLTQRVLAACRVVGHVFDRDDTVSRQGLMKALSHCGPELVKLMIQSLSAHLMSLNGYWTQKGKVNIAVDGSKFAAPRTKENQAYFAAAQRKDPASAAAKGKRKKRKNYKRTADHSKASTVQVLVTVFWHLAAGLPLRWMTSASNGSERKQALEMLNDLPRNARLIGDAEYVGYPLWSAIGHSGRSFLVRVGSNVTLLKKLGKCRVQEGFVYYWPDRVMTANDPPLVLRLFQIHEGKKAIFLVTNELDMDDKTAGTLYSWRWKLEIFFRTVKQTCEQAKLHCLRPKNVLTELNWGLLGIWYALYTGKQALVNEGLPVNTLSPVKVMNALWQAVAAILQHTTGTPLLAEQLAAAVLSDETQRTSRKASRNFPRKKKHKRCGPPTVLEATQEQQSRARVFHL